MAVAGKISTYIMGRLFEGLRDITIHTSMKNLCGSFSFSYDPTKIYTLPNGRSGPLPSPTGNSQQPTLQDTCEFYIDDNKIFTGYIEDVTGGYSSTTHSITFTGRSKTLEIVDHTIVKGVNYLAPPLTQLTYQQLFTSILKDNELTNQKVIFDPSFKNLGATLLIQGEKAITETGESVFKVLDTYAKKLNAILITDPEGNLLVTKGNSTSFVGNLTNKINGTAGAGSNNILEADFGGKTSSRFSKYTLLSQLDTTVSKGSDKVVDTSLNTTQLAFVIDPDIKLTKEKVVLISSATPKGVLQKMVEWQANLAKTAASTYRCKVFDYYTSSNRNSIWEINKMANVDDDFSLTKGPLLIDSVSYIKSNSGTFSQLTLVNKNSYSNREYTNSIAAGVSGTVASASL